MVDEQLRLAITNKRLIKFRYHGSVRVAEPHDYGIQKRIARVLVYQLRGSGPSPRRSLTGWRLLDVPKIEECAVLEEAFPGSRGHSHKHHLVWDIVYARVT
jgi:hypothetical protein